MGGKVDLDLLSATARNDVRAVYGGLDLGIAAFLVIGLLRPHWTRQALGLATITFGSLLSVRTLDWIVAGGFEGLVIWLGAAEAVGLALNAAAWRLECRKTEGRSS